MAVEVKREVDDKDAGHHLKRMELIRMYSPLEAVGKRTLGAIADEMAPPDRVEYAHKAVFFALAFTGESIVSLDAPIDFAAREWQAMRHEGASLGAMRGRRQICSTILRLGWRSLKTPPIREQRFSSGMGMRATPIFSALRRSTMTARNSGIFF
ncbi:MAG: hypothetical protein LBG43_05850 [Treponema sp.]|jgi:hypothetical protein|nr:hypothetical protein [Treponema sp.]